MSTRIDNWPLKRVGLRVHDLDMMKKFYKNLGLKVLKEEHNDNGRSVSLGSEGGEVLTLRELIGGHNRPINSAGLFHFALLVPEDKELGSFLQHTLNNQIQLEGAADHLVSQAIYLRDPEGNGIEIYSDRDPKEWEWQDKSIRMDTLRLNSSALLHQAKPFNGFSEDLVLGHMHLNVGNLEKSNNFYRSIGLDLTSDWIDQAKFLSWDKYHHHVGINVWEGKDSKPLDEKSYGLDFFEIQKPITPTTLIDTNGIEIRGNKD